ncbi:hypothetical protein PHET_03020 [Paragonimus heterotremus]|uniref:Lethal giant larvae homologue 2 domain-containing protein n=1 Tax=Paragonimus heterotremus TaxID=100268 RepID=A0A8J4SRC7_9TREM|nr:hypothetical protein PHET_03020 [Paragonimus heterotremus]
MASRSKKLLKVIDGIRAWNVSASQANSHGSPPDIVELLKSDHFQVGKIAIHGFPYHPTCMAFDPVQKIIALGTKAGVIRIFGRPGVDYVVFHPSSSAVIQIIFLVNEGGLVSICQDDVVHLWNIRQKNPELVHSLQFKRERLVCGHVPVGSGWLYLGTDKGNVHFVNVQRFATSGYVINWNKAIDMNQSVHPGRVIQIAENPQDSSKLLIGYSSGFLVLWDLRTKSAEARFKYSENLNGFCWHWEGKQFMTCHNFGLLATWSLRQPQRPTAICCPHAGTEAVPDNYTSYEPIICVDWLPCKTGEPFIVFAGGGCTLGMSSGGKQSGSDCIPTDPTNPSSPDAPPPNSVISGGNGGNSMRSGFPSLTVKRGKRLVVMQMDHRLIEFVSLNTSPYCSELMDPYAIAVLLQDDLVVVDLLSENYATFENPYPMDLHSSPVTSCLYLVDCPGDLVPAFYSVGSRGNRTHRTGAADADTFSTREWPISGGEWGLSYNPYPELVLTGHADGSVRFWDASEATLIPLYKVRTHKYFDTTATCHDTVFTEEAKRSPTATTAGVNANFSPNLLSTEVDPYAIRSMHFCPESRRLLTMSVAHVCLLHFSRLEQQYETPFIDINMAYDCLDDLSGPATGDTFADDQFAVGTSGTMTKENAAYRHVLHSRPSGSVSSAHSAFTTDRDVRVFVPIRPGVLSWQPGYQPTLICRMGIPALGTDALAASVGYANDPTLLPPPPITAVSLNSSYGLIAVGNECGFAVVDYNSRVCLISTSIADLSSISDLYNRIPNRSPGRVAASSPWEGRAVEQPCISSPPPRPPPPRAIVHPPVHKPPHTSDALLPPELSPLDPTEPARLCCCSCGQPSSTTSASTHAMNVTHARARHDSPKLSTRHSNGFTQRVSSTEHCVSLSQQRLAPFSTNDQIVNTPKPKPNLLNRLGDWSFTVLDLRSNKPRFYHLFHATEDHADMSQVACKINELVLVSPICTALVLSCCTRSAMSSQVVAPEKWTEFGQGSQSCSLSTSTSSLDQLNNDGVKCLVFCDSYTRRQDSNSGPCLWIGTTRGNVLTVSLNTRELRMHHVVNLIPPTGSIFRLNGDIIHVGFLDLTGDLITAPAEKWEDVLFSNQSSRHTNTTPSSSNLSEHCGASAGLRQGDSNAAARRLGTSALPKISKDKSGSSNTRTSSSSTSSSSGAPHLTHQASLAGTPDPSVANVPPDMDKQLVVLCSEKQACVLALPSQTCLFKAKITETSHVVRANIQRFRSASFGDSVGSTTFLACYLANGHFIAFSLPGLRLLMDVDYLPYTESVSRSFAFGQHGQAIYLTTPSELLKITWSSDVW